jgi:catechol 2,3-dioxygenase-like lactoylglutathione lyase family enzyme
MITSFDHVTVRASDLQTSWRFYEDVLGLKLVERLGASAPGAIGSIADVQVLHLFQANDEQNARFGPSEPVTDVQVTSWRTGRLQHFGFWAENHREMKARFEQHAVAYRERTMADKHQLVVYDPDGIEIEINFPLSEVAG